MKVLAWYQVFSNYHNINFHPNKKIEKISINQNLSGDCIQLELSNEYDEVPLNVKTIRVSLNQNFKQYKQITLNGQPSFTIPSFSKVWTDVVKFIVPPKKKLFFQLELENETNKLNTSANLLSKKIVNSNVYEKSNFLYGLTSVKLYSKDTQCYNIGFFGDSLTNQGYFSDAVLENLYKNTPHDNMKFTGFNAGISGNRLLLPGNSDSEWKDSFGQAGIERFEQDVLQYKPDVVVSLIGINDLFHPGAGSPSKELPDLKTFILGYEKLAMLSKNKVFIPLTLPPFKGAMNKEIYSWNQEKETLRVSINHWMKSTYKNCIDIDSYVKNKSIGTKLDSIFDSGDHLHFSENGGKIIGGYVADRITMILLD